MSKIIYFPDFNSGKDSRKYEILKKYFKESYDFHFVDWQDHHHIPALLNTTKREQGSADLIIGDSVGANLAFQFRELLDPHWRTNLLLLNPLFDINSKNPAINYPLDLLEHMKKISPREELHDSIIIYCKENEMNDYKTLSKPLPEFVKVLNADNDPALDRLENYLPFVAEFITEKKDYYRRYYRLLNYTHSALLGLAVGDALGVPVEFKSRKNLERNPVKYFLDKGTHNQSLGTFSGDSSMAFCLAENLVEGYNIEGITKNFIKYYQEGFWSARGEVPVTDTATQQALKRMINGATPLKEDENNEYSAGNGLLMRILPLLFYVHEMPIEERFRITMEVASITHRQIPPIVSCFYYLEFARLIFNGKTLQEAFDILKDEFPQNLKKLKIPNEETMQLKRLFSAGFNDLPEEEIKSSSYIIHTLEASIWCLLKTNNYRNAVLKAVNLGDNTHATGGVTGGLAGMFYGANEIPRRWRSRLARNLDIFSLGQKLTDKFFIN